MKGGRLSGRRQPVRTACAIGEGLRVGRGTELGACSGHPAESDLFAEIGLDCALGGAGEVAQAGQVEDVDMLALHRE
jgi:hypothetical protein